MWVSSWVPMFVNQRGWGVSEIWISFVRLNYTRAIRQITRAPLSYIHKNYWLTDVTKTACRQPTQFLCTNLYILIYTQNLWCGDICCTVNTLIDVKFPEGSFESQQFAAADGRTGSLRFVRLVTFPLQKNIVISLYSFLPEIWKTNS